MSDKPVVRYEVVDGIGVITVDYPPVNALGPGVSDGIVEAVDKAQNDPAVKALVLMGAGRSFIAGADIRRFGTPRPPSPRRSYQALEESNKPVVAAIHGYALGGGLENALCCTWRIAVPSAKVGLPEVLIGILPGGGGTQRLPRLIGPKAALEMIVTGRHVPAPEAKELGIIDALIEGKDLRAEAIAFAKSIIGKPLRRLSEMPTPPAEPGLFDKMRRSIERKARNQKAPYNCIAAVEASVKLPFAEGMAEERRLFSELENADEAKALRYAFFAEREVARIPFLPKDAKLPEIKTVAVVGAGTMGGGIAMNFANVGIPVTLVETKQEALERGLGVIRKNYETTAKRGKLKPEDVEKRMGLLTGTLELEKLADCDLVIEAVFENMDVKKDVFGKLDKIVKQGAILASNTSYLDVNEIARATKRPEWVLGLHFFSPANVMRLLEVVRGEKTSKQVIATAMQLAKKIGKIGVLVGVCHGFVGNRMLAARQAQAQAMLLEGAMPWDVDKPLYDFGMPMGPFAMGDLAGLDIGWSKETSKSSTVREVLCEMDRRGQKTGAGFYDYDEQRNAKPSAVTEKIIKDFAAKAGVTPRQISEQEILERCIYPMINEGAKILEEKIAIRPSDIDIVWINGYGWPVYRGGPMFYADTVGLANVVAKLKEYGPKLGADFRISPLLEKLAAEGKRFQDLR